MAVSAMVCCVVSQSCPSPADLLTVNLTAVLATVGIMMGFVMFSLFLLISLSLCPVMDFVYLHSFVSSISSSIAVSSIFPSLVPCLLSFASRGPYI